MAEKKTEGQVAQQLEQEYRMIVQAEPTLSLPRQNEMFEQPRQHPLTRIVTTYGAYEEPF